MSRRRATRWAATVIDRDGPVRSWLTRGRPCRWLPHRVASVTAGPTTYEVEVVVPARCTPTGVLKESADGSTTLTPPVRTATQHLLVLVGR